MKFDEVMERLRAAGNPAAVAGMARFGIETERAYGISAPVLHRLAQPLPQPRRNRGSRGNQGRQPSWRAVGRHGRPARVGVRGGPTAFEAMKQDTATQKDQHGVQSHAWNMVFFAAVSALLLMLA